DLKIRFVNVVNIMTLAKPASHPDGISDSQFEQLFTPTVPVIFAFHGYPAMIHRLIYNRGSHEDFHVHGFNEEGTTTTPFDMLVLNKLDRFNLIKNAISRLKTIKNAPEILDKMNAMLKKHHLYIADKGDDLIEIKNFNWKYDSKSS